MRRTRFTGDEFRRLHRGTLRAMLTGYPRTRNSISMHCSASSTLFWSGAGHMTLWWPPDGSRYPA
jgi:hypothetical protein